MPEQTRMPSALQPELARLLPHKLLCPARKSHPACFLQQKLLRPARKPHPVCPLQHKLLCPARKPHPASFLQQRLLRPAVNPRFVRSLPGTKQVHLAQLRDGPLVMHLQTLLHLAQNKHLLDILPWAHHHQEILRHWKLCNVTQKCLLPLNSWPSA